VSAAPARCGTLYLVPTPLDFGLDASEPLAPLDHLLPGDTVATASRLTHWITENAKSTRAFLKRIDRVSPLAAPIQAQQIAELPRATHKKGDHTPDAQTDADARLLLQPALNGEDMGLVSEAGMPAIADPGSSVVRAAHALSIPVIPLTGPVSLMLALAASGLNGQQFAFVGYVPQAPAERTKRLHELEALALKTGQTQILIETPYRNAALLEALVKTLTPGTRLAVCCGLSLATPVCRSAMVRDWQQRRLGVTPQALSLPSVFLIGR
jgi:16S rRNA (cytidine1402-2'-O)-methyltransferase